MRLCSVALLAIVSCAHAPPTPASAKHIERAPAPIAALTFHVDDQTFDNDVAVGRRYVGALKDALRGAGLRVVDQGPYDISIRVYGSGDQSWWAIVSPEIGYDDAWGGRYERATTGHGETTETPAPAIPVIRDAIDACAAYDDGHGLQHVVGPSTFKGDPASVPSFRIAVDRSFDGDAARLTAVEEVNWLTGCNAFASLAAFAAASHTLASNTVTDLDDRQAMLLCGSHSAEGCAELARRVPGFTRAGDVHQAIVTLAGAREEVAETTGDVRPYADALERVLQSGDSRATDAAAFACAGPASAMCRRACDLGSNSACYIGCVWRDDGAQCTSLADRLVRTRPALAEALFARGCAVAKQPDGNACLGIAELVMHKDGALARFALAQARTIGNADGGRLAKVGHAAAQVARATAGPAAKAAGLPICEEPPAGAAVHPPEPLPGIRYLASWRPKWTGRALTIQWVPANIDDASVFPEADDVGELFVSFINNSQWLTRDVRVEYRGLPVQQTTSVGYHDHVSLSCRIPPNTTCGGGIKSDPASGCSCSGSSDFNYVNVDPARGPIPFPKVGDVSLEIVSMKIDDLSPTCFDPDAQSDKRLDTMPETALRPLNDLDGAVDGVFNQQSCRDGDPCCAAWRSLDAVSTQLGEGSISGC